jgi:hypothetical protein
MTLNNTDIGVSLRPQMMREAPEPAYRDLINGEGMYRPA